MSAETTALEILGDDFIPPGTLKRIFGDSFLAKYRDEDVAFMIEKIPDENTLVELQRNGFMLVAGPPRPLSLLDLYSTQDDYFGQEPGNWFSKDSESFSSFETVNTWWYVLSKFPIHSALDLTWFEQRKYLTHDVPNITEMVWAMFLYKRLYNYEIFDSSFVRSISYSFDGYRPTAGFYCEKIYIEAVRDNSMKVQRFEDHTLGVIHKVAI